MKESVLICPKVGIGDITMRIPIIKFFRNKDVNLVILGNKKGYLSFLKENDLIDDFISLNQIIHPYLSISDSKEVKNKMDEVDDFKSNKFETIINFRDSSSFTKKFLEKLFDCNNYISARSSDIKNKSGKNDYILEKFYDYEIEEKDYYFNKELIKKIKNKRAVEKDEYITLHPYSQSEDRRIKKEFLEELIDKIDKSIVLIGSDFDKLKDFTKDMKKYEGVITDVLGNDYISSLSAIYHSNYLITGDTGPMHWSLALKNKTISLWGPTSSDNVLRKTSLSEEIVFPDGFFAENELTAKERDIIKNQLDKVERLFN